MNPTTSLIYILFRQTEIVSEKSHIDLGGLIFFKKPTEPWQSEVSIDEGKPADRPQKLEFVCQAQTPQEIAAEVRKAPLEKYFLFHGTITPVQIAMPVFVGGKNLETLNKEWNERED